MISLYVLFLAKYWYRVCRVFILLLPLSLWKKITYDTLVSEKSPKMNDTKKLYSSVGLLVYIILLSLFGQNATAQNNNFDLSDGTFSGWELYNGELYELPTNPTTADCCSTPDSLRKEIITTSVPDTITGELLSSLPEGVSIGARLGNKFVGAETDRIRYDYEVIDQDYILTYYYAVVLQEPANFAYHMPDEFPRFDVTAEIVHLDGTVELLECESYSVSTYTASSEFTLFDPEYDDSNNLWKDWTQIGIDLNKYDIGEKIRLTFDIYDCALGGHFGYAYIAFEENSRIIDVEQCGINDIYLTAPSGYEYLWETGETTQSIYIVDPSNPDTVDCQLITNSIECDTIELAAYISQYYSILTDTLSCNETTELHPCDIAPNATYEWSPPYGLDDITLPSPILETAYTSGTTVDFELTVSNAGAYNDKDTVSVYFEDNIAEIDPFKRLNCYEAWEVCPCKEVTSATYQWVPSVGLIDPETGGDGSQIACPTIEPMFGMPTDVTSDFYPYVYQQVGSNEPSINYKLYVTDALGGIDSSYTVITHGYDLMNFAPEIAQPGQMPGEAIINCGETIHISPCKIVDGATYSWSPTIGLSNPNIANPSINYDLIPSDILYTISVYYEYSDESIFNGESTLLVKRKFCDADAGEDADICIGDQIQIGSNNYSDHQYDWTPTTWIEDPTQGNPFISPDASISYILKVTDPNGVITQDYISIVVEDCNTGGGDGVGIEENWLQTMDFYPNPTNGMLNISWSKFPGNAKAQLYIYDVLGKIIHTSELDGNKYQTDLSHLNAGIYFCKVVYDGRVSRVEQLRLTKS